MIARRFGVAGVLAVSVVAAAPVVANAAPVQLHSAIVSARELPVGSSEYALSTTLAPVPEKPTRDAPCDRTAYRVKTSLAGSKAAEVSATRGDDGITVRISDRPGVRDSRDVITACNTDPGVVPQVTVDPPSDLARHTLLITRTRDGKLTQAVVDLRGISVTVAVVNMNRAIDSSTFWQVLRTQVAKVERQP